MDHWITVDLIGGRPHRRPRRRARDGQGRRARHSRQDAAGAHATRAAAHASRLQAKGVCSMVIERPESVEAKHWVTQALAASVRITVEDYGNEPIADCATAIGPDEL